MQDNNDNLFENFRRNEHKLNERPSADAWTKLEARLNKQERSVPGRQRPTPIFRLMSIAASVLLLVGLSFVVSQTFMKPNIQAIAAATPEKLEDLPTLQPDSYSFSTEVAEYQRRVNANPRGIIREGDVQKRLVVHSGNVGAEPKMGIRGDSI